MRNAFLFLATWVFVFFVFAVGYIRGVRATEDRINRMYEQRAAAISAGNFVQGTVTMDGATTVTPVLTAAARGTLGPGVFTISHAYVRTLDGDWIEPKRLHTEIKADGLHVTADGRSWVLP